MSNHEVSSDMENNNGCTELNHVIFGMKRSINFITQNDDNNQFTDVVDHLCEVVENLEALRTTIIQTLYQYADLFDSIDLWIGGDAGPNTIRKKYEFIKKLEENIHD